MSGEVKVKETRGTSKSLVAIESTLALPGTSAWPLIQRIVDSVLVTGAFEGAPDRYRKVSVLAWSFAREIKGKGQAHCR